MKIILSGMPGAGKSSVAKLVATKLGYRHYSTGDVQRQLAEERGLTITQWGELENTDPKYDNLVDDRVKKLLAEEDNIVMDSWIASYFAKESAIKIFLDCEENERARRRLPQKRSTEAFDSIPKIIEDMRQRVSTNRERWLKYYNHDFLDLGGYDLVIDTTTLSMEQVADKIIEYVHDFS